MLLQLMWNCAGSQYLLLFIFSFQSISNQQQHDITHSQCKWLADTAAIPIRDCLLHSHRKWSKCNIIYPPITINPYPSVNQSINYFCSPCTLNKCSQRRGRVQTHIEQSSAPVVALRHADTCQTSSANQSSISWFQHNKALLVHRTPREAKAAYLG